MSPLLGSLPRYPSIPRQRSSSLFLCSSAPGLYIFQVSKLGSLKNTFETMRQEEPVPRQILTLFLPMSLLFTRLRVLGRAAIKPDSVWSAQGWAPMGRPQLNDYHSRRPDWRDQEGLEQPQGVTSDLSPKFPP